MSRVASEIQSAAAELAQLRELAVVETDAPSAEDMRQVWENLGLSQEMSITGGPEKPGYGGLAELAAKALVEREQREEPL